MVIVIPAAGNGKRFQEKGYVLPKPFIDVLGKPMVCHVLDQFKSFSSKIVLELREEHYNNHKDLISPYLKGVNIVLIPRLTEGAVCTVLEAYDFINTEDELIIANSDQTVDCDLSEFIENARSRDLDCSILCFEDQNPKWSYARLEKGLVQEVTEKKVISNFATVGIYYFKHGSNFVSAAEQMILTNDRVNREFYTAPSINYLIKVEKKVGIYLIDQDKMHGLGTPEDLERYLEWCENG